MTGSRPRLLICGCQGTITGALCCMKGTDGAGDAAAGGGALKARSKAPQVAMQQMRRGLQAAVCGAYLELVRLFSLQLVDLSGARQVAEADQRVERLGSRWGVAVDGDDDGTTGLTPER